MVDHAALKPDTIEAEDARVVLVSLATVVPKSADGIAEAVRRIKVA